MNILILGSGSVEQKIIDICLKSKRLDKIYTASINYLENIPNVEFSDFDELCKKAKSLQIDVILVTDKDLIREGVVEFCKKNLLNVISVNKKWFNLEESKIIAKKLINYYSINTPEVLKAPKSFPVVIKTDKNNWNKIAYSMQELIQIRESFTNETVFLEDYLTGDLYNFWFLWDGKTLLNLPSKFDLTEVQQDRLDLLKTKLSFMLSDEKADFIGFFGIKNIWAKNDWHVLNFIMRPNQDFYYDFKIDFIYLLNSIIYQKLDEVDFY